MFIHHPLVLYTTGLFRGTEYTEKCKYDSDQNSETTEFRSPSSASGAVGTFFSYPQGELFEQNSDFSNSAQGHGFPLRPLCL